DRDERPARLPRRVVARHLVPVGTVRAELGKDRDPVLERATRPAHAVRACVDRGVEAAREHPRVPLGGREAGRAHAHEIDEPRLGRKAPLDRVDRARPVVPRQAELARDVVARPGRDDPERDPRLGEDVDPEVDDPVPADDDERVDPLRDRPLRRGARLLGRAAREVENLVPALAQLADGPGTDPGPAPTPRGRVHDDAEGAHASSPASARAALRSARRSCNAHRPTAAKYNAQIGIARANIEIASAVGVATAANTNASSTAHRQPASHVLARTMPARLSPTMTTGSRNAGPKASTIRMMKVRYSCAVMRLRVFSGVKLVRIPTAWGMNHHASHAPARNSGTPEATKPAVYHRSLRVSPGVTKAHSW